MKKYVSFFKLRFINGLSYRAAALGGIITQFFWGALQILMFKAFYEGNASAFPMKFSALTSYIWMQQAFLALYMVWFMENEIFEAIHNGNLSYELCRPLELYNMWFARSMATRLSSASLRCIPLIIFSYLLPKPYGLTIPSNPQVLLMTCISMGLSLFVVLSFCMIIYIITFYTISPLGVRIVTASIAEFFSGGIIPLPFLPDKLQKILEILPFGSMQNVPFRIFSGDIPLEVSYKAILLQLFWMILLTALGKRLFKTATKRAVVQGG